MGRKEKPSSGKTPRGLMEKFLDLYPPPFTGEAKGEGIKEVGVKSKSPSNRLDLHGMTREEAIDSLKDFIRNCRRKGVRRALIIHGKGSSAPAVLRPLALEILKTLPEVEDFGPAAPAEGGRGATWILLRQRSR